MLSKICHQRCCSTDEHWNFCYLKNTPTVLGHWRKWQILFREKHPQRANGVGALAKMENFVFLKTPQRPNCVGARANIGNFVS